MMFYLEPGIFHEENLIEQFRHAIVEEKQIFYSKIIKPYIYVANEPFPLDIILFNEESQWVISFLSQFLGLDNDKFVPEFLLSLLFRLSLHQSVSESNQLSFLTFDEFLGENIDSRLVNFHTTRHFKFQSYLVRMFLFFNEENMQFLEILFTHLKSEIIPSTI